MITVKIADLLNSTDTLQKLAGTNLKARSAWQVARLLKAADAEIRDFNEARMKLITKYGEKNEEGNLVTDETGNCKIQEEFITNFSSELNDLINTDIEINANKIKLDDLENLDFTPNEMTILETFLEFE